MGQITPRLIAIALLSISTMSLVPVLIKSSAANIETLGLSRLIIAVLLITPVLIFKKACHGLTRRDWAGLGVVGIVFSAHWWSYFYAIKTAGPSIAAIAMATFGIFLLLFNGLLYRRQVRFIEGLSVLFCTIGCFFVVPEVDVNPEAALGFMAGIGSAVLYGAMPLLHQRIKHLPTLTRAWGQFAFSGVVFLALWPQTDWQLSTTDWWGIFALGTICTVLAHGLWVKASSELPAMVTSGIYYLYIPLTMVQSFLFLQEKITTEMILGAVIIIAANLMLLIYPWLQQRKRQRLFVG